MAFAAAVVRFPNFAAVVVQFLNLSIAVVRFLNVVAATVRSYGHGPTDNMMAQSFSEVDSNKKWYASN